jgi:glycosyltransferase involved in cell wall biosynthesis
MDVMPSKVLHVMNASDGGAACSTVQLMKELKKFGLQSCAVCHSQGTKTSREELLEATNGETEFHPLYWWNHKTRADAWKRPLLELYQSILTGHGRKSALHVASCALKMNADLIHSNTLMTREGAFAARLLRLPHVWHARELVGSSQHCHLPLHGKKLIQFFRRFASFMVANSEVTAKSLGYPDQITSDLIRVIPNGVDVGLFAPKNGVVGRPLVVGMVANLTSTCKRHDLFIEAASMVEKNNDVSFRIYGFDPSQNGKKSAGRYVDGIHRLVRDLKMSDRILLPGFNPNPADIMREIDVAVHPFEGESFGRVVIEAMAAECPVVGPRGGGVGEIVRHGKTGLLVEPKNPAKLAEAIEQLIRNPALRKEMGKKGRIEVREKYALDVHTQKIMEVYCSAMERPLRWRKGRMESR